MAQFWGSDVAISILTDDEEEDDASENEIDGRNEPETESKSARRPMIRRRDRSRDSSDSQTDLSNGVCGDNTNKQRYMDASGSGAMETGSDVCLGPTAMLILCLLVVAFPVYFPGVLLPDVRSTDDALRLTVSLAIVGSIASSLTSRLAFKMADFRSATLSGCVAVLVFAVLRCLRSAPAAVYGCGAFVAGFFLAAVRTAVAARYRHPADHPRRADADDRITYLGSTAVVLTCSGLAPFVSASLYLALLATYEPADYTRPEVTSSPVTPSSLTSFPPGNATPDANLSSLSNVSDDSVDNVSSSTYFTIVDNYYSSVSSYGVRLVSLSVCYVVCSLGALLLAICSLDVDEGRRKEKSSWTVSGVAGLVLGPLNAFTRQDVALTSLFASFVGAQQLFAYFAYIQVNRILQLIIFIKAGRRICSRVAKGRNPHRRTSWKLVRN